MSSSAGSPDALDTLLRTLASRPRPLRLVGRVQPYAWGGREYLRDLTGLALAAGTPAAEWWIGAHPSAPSMASIQPGGPAVPLDVLIARAPEPLLGARVHAKFGARLPFLLKVLDVGQMLSIQVHPTKPQAQAGFARENAAGIALDAPHRTYRDDNHKPEAQVALSPFWMLFGFREPDALGRVLAERPELAPLGHRLAALQAAPMAENDRRSVAQRLFEHVMTLPQADVDALVAPLVARLLPALEAGRLPRDTPDFWAARASRQFRTPDGGHDRGILTIYLMNLVTLAPGEGRYFGAGLVHAYLEGIAVEVMANSDNVIRGGLTSKHVDVPELMRVLDFGPSLPQPLRTEDIGAVALRYAAPAAEFGLDRLRFNGGDQITGAASDGPTTIVVIEGRATLRTHDDTLPLERGGAVLVPARVEYQITAAEPALLFRAYVP